MMSGAMGPDDIEKEVAEEAESFASHVEAWESAWGQRCGLFTDMTALSSMQYTHCTPGQYPYAASTPETLQIFSIRLVEIARDRGLDWPLSVYGVIAARDIVDHNRNILFSCSRDRAQALIQEDSFLRLIGPSRAIVSTDKVILEIQLKIKGETMSLDKALITYWSGYSGIVPRKCVRNCLCMIELCSERVKSTIQATIMGVKVVKNGPWPFEYGGRVACSSRPGEFVIANDGVIRRLKPSASQIVLLESKDRAIPERLYGHVHLSRQVVSVVVEGALDVVIQAYSKSGEIAAKGCVQFIPKFSNISQDKCALGDAKAEVSVAWSQLATDRRNVVSLGLGL